MAEISIVMGKPSEPKGVKNICLILKSNTSIQDSSTVCLLPMKRMHRRVEDVGSVLSSHKSLEVDFTITWAVGKRFC